uniref:Open reading frame RF2 n=1 Tax=Saccharomyces cerevisiae TaxID=4932 RepID=Q7GHK6_YEASX|nr:ORF RF2 [Saccharomyces cerevisiae]AAA67531.1 ORF3 [Saccharomyces cerevisiae]
MMNYYKYEGNNWFLNMFNKMYNMNYTFLLLYNNYINMFNRIKTTRPDSFGVRPAGAAGTLFILYINDKSLIIINKFIYNI